MEWDEKLKSFLDDRPNPFLHRYITKISHENNMKNIKWSDKTTPEEYYSLCFKEIKGELNLRKGLEEYYFQWQVANNLLDSNTAQAEEIVGMMQESGVFSLAYSNMVKEFNNTKNWDDTKFQEIWDKAIKLL